MRVYAISGTINVGPLPLTLPAGSTFTATVETTTGAFTDGKANIPTFPAAGVPNPTTVTIVDLRPGTGTIDPATGAATTNVNLSVALTTTTPVSTCTISPVALTLSTTGAGGAPFAGSPPTATQVASGFTVPAITTPAAPPCDNTEAMKINNFLMLPQTTTSATITLTQSSPGPTAPAAPATPASQVARPSFTG